MKIIFETNEIIKCTINGIDAEISFNNTYSKFPDIDIKWKIIKKLTKHFQAIKLIAKNNK